MKRSHNAVFLSSGRAPTSPRKALHCQVCATRIAPAAIAYSRPIVAKRGGNRTVDDIDFVLTQREKGTSQRLCGSCVKRNSAQYDAIVNGGRARSSRAEAAAEEEEREMRELMLGGAVGGCDLKANDSSEDEEKSESAGENTMRWMSPKGSPRRLSEDAASCSESDFERPMKKQRRSPPTLVENVLEGSSIRPIALDDSSSEEYSESPFLTEASLSERTVASNTKKVNSTPVIMSENKQEKSEDKDTSCAKEASTIPPDAGLLHNNSNSSMSAVSAFFPHRISLSRKELQNLIDSLHGHQVGACFGDVRVAESFHVSCARCSYSYSMLKSPAMSKEY